MDDRDLDRRLAAIEAGLAGLSTALTRLESRVEIARRDSQATAGDARRLLMICKGLRRTARAAAPLLSEIRDAIQAADSRPDKTAD